MPGDAWRRGDALVDRQTRRQRTEESPGQRPSGPALRSSEAASVQPPANAVHSGRTIYADQWRLCGVRTCGVLAAAAQSSGCGTLRHVRVTLLYRGGHA